MNHITEILILSFLTITFLQSGYDKFTDYQGNLEWLKEHFKNSLLDGKVAMCLKIILVFECIASLFCIVGGIELLLINEKNFARYGVLLSCITLLMLLFGQRVAKDYDGARTIAIYFIVAIIGMYILQ